MPFELGNDAGLTISLRDNGAVEAIRSGGVLINQVLGNDAEGGLGNIYLRRRAGESVAVASLRGPGSGSRFGTIGREARWEGTLEGIEYRCSLRLAPDALVWFWTLRLANTTHEPIKLDVVLAQDVGLAAEAAVRTSELYTSQYIDHTPIEDPRFGFLLCSRQNLPQQGAAPWVMHGCIEGAAGYLTDGFQLYGLDYRATSRPAALERATFPNEVYQYEVALPTLQSGPVVLEPGARTEVTFFVAYEPDHPAASGPGDAPRAAEVAAMVGALPGSDPALRPAPVVSGRFARPAPFDAEDLTVEDLDRYFGTERRHVEGQDGALLSFFHGDGQHVVLRAKELLVERPTGHIMLSGTEPFPTDDRLAVTAWMSGVFGSQLTIGNTSFHKVLSVVRNPLNVLKSGGQRIFVLDQAGGELLLGVPSAFEMTPATARWIYKDSSRTLVITVATDPVEPTSRLTIEVERGEPVELVVTHHLVLGEHEGGPRGSVDIDVDRGRVRMQPGAETLFAQRYPAATIHLVAPDPSPVRSIDVEGEHLVIATEPIRRFDLAITGSILDEELAQSRASSALLGGTRAPPSLPSIAVHGGTGRMADDIARLDDTLRWYAHNATIHYVSPHGLEQTGGAAWGVRDVCQGPVEYLLATGSSAPVRDILRTVYEHQYAQTGDWPQWFMFDRYGEIQQADSHGDVIHWPLKALCDYLEATNDLAFLDKELAYTDIDTMQRTTDTDTVFAHVERQIERIEQDVIPGTALPIYGGGDWEDTLQPADPDLARNLVSAWTTELAFQTLRRFREVCIRAGRGATAQRLETLTERIRADLDFRLGLLTLSTMPALFIVRLFWLPRGQGSPSWPRMRPIRLPTGRSRKASMACARCRAWSASTSISTSMTRRCWANLKTHLTFGEICAGDGTDRRHADRYRHGDGYCRRRF